MHIQTPLSFGSFFLLKLWNILIMFKYVNLGHGPGMGTMLAGGAAAAAAAYGVHQLTSSHGHGGGHNVSHGAHNMMGGPMSHYGGGKFKHGKHGGGKFKHGKHGKHGKHKGKHSGYKKWK